MKKTKLLFLSLPLFAMTITGCAKTGPQGPQGEQGIQGLQGPRGDDGVSVVAITKTSTDGLVDTYTITYSNNTSSTFTVTNGQNGSQGIQGEKGQDGHTPEIMIGENGHWFIDGVDTNIKAQGDKGDKGDKGEDGQDGQDGVSVTSIVKTSSEGLVDTYTITFSNNTTSTFTVTNGAQGEQGIQGEKGADGKTHSIRIARNGNWQIDGIDTGIAAQGPQGEQGKSAYDLYVEQYPGYRWGQTQWVKDLASNKLALTIEFDTDGGEPIEPLIAFKGEVVIINQVAVKEHATFNGWYFDIEREHGMHGSFLMEKSLTLYADYIYDDTVVTYLSNGEVIDTVEVPYLGQITEPDDPTPPIGFQFVGWKEQGADELFDFETTCTKHEYVLEAVYDYDFLELPAIVINTNDGSDITSKEEYTSSTVSVLNTKEEWTLNEVSAGVRGRGNSSWGQPKKPYRIKFDKKQSMLGSDYKAKSWTLIANYSDKTLSRNYLAYELSERFSGLDFTSKHSFVDLYLNNEYKGVYLLCDQIQTGKGRVDIDDSIAEDGNNGYLIERDGRAPNEGIENQDYFIFDGDDSPYVIKTPDTEEEEFLNNKETEIAYIKGYMQQCWDAIGDSNDDWSLVEQLIDVDSFADQYIIDELFVNPDCGWASCYYYKDKDGKLFKGPVWDFDLSAGNYNYGLGNEEECSPTSALYANKANSWYKRLLKKTEFVNIVKAKLQSYSGIVDDVIELSNSNKDSSLYKLYKNALERNFDKWDIMGQYVWPEPESVYSIDSLNGQFDYIYNWLNSRYSFICEQYSVSIA